MRMLRRLPLTAAATAVVMSLSLPAQAGTADGTAPTVSIQQTASFVVGSSITPIADPNLSSWHHVPVTIGWRGSDASGICGYDLLIDDAAHGDEGRAYVVQNSKVTKYAYTATDYDNSYGGSEFGYREFDVTAHDCAGNTATEHSGLFRPEILQDDNGGPDVAFNSMHAAYTGAWTVARCSCFSLGTTHTTSTAGDRVSFTTDATTNNKIGLVMEKAPNRGAVVVYVDGRRRATVDTYASAPTHRVVVFQTGVGAGSHRMTVVNVATSGRPRVDVDAFLTMSVLPWQPHGCGC